MLPIYLRLKKAEAKINRFLFFNFNWFLNPKKFTPKKS